jgi:uncharacterized protein
MSKLSRLTNLLAVIVLFFPDHSRAAQFDAYQWYGNAFHIEISGPITAGDNDRFRKLVLSEIRSGHVVSGIHLNSPGGNVSEALGIGRVIRQLKASTYAPSLRSGKRLCQTGSLDNISYEDSSSCECASACSLIWEAGVGRLGELVGIHRPRYDEATYKDLTPDQATKQYSEVLVETTKYFAEMGVPDWLSSRMYSVPSSDMHYLKDTELQEFSNSSPALGELVIARCGNVPSGTIFDNPERKNYVDCAFTINIDQVVKGNRGFLATSGNSEDSGRVLAWAAPMIQSARPPNVAPLPSGSPQPSSPPQIETSLMGPSFDCQNSTASDERTICANSRLAAMDRRLDDLYSAAKLRPNFSFIRNGQRGWLASRRSCSTNEVCISAAYETRIAELELASSPGPSFECSGSLHADEAAICKNSNLQALDRRLYQLYSVLRTDPRVVKSQRVWLARRHGCQSDTTCLLASYQSRVYQLQNGQW